MAGVGDGYGGDVGDVLPRNTHRTHWIRVFATKSAKLDQQVVVPVIFPGVAHRCLGVILKTPSGHGVIKRINKKSIKESSLLPVGRSVAGTYGSYHRLAAAASQSASR